MLPIFFGVSSVRSRPVEATRNLKQDPAAASPTTAGGNPLELPAQGTAGAAAAGLGAAAAAGQEPGATLNVAEVCTPEQSQAVAAKFAELQKTVDRWAPCGDAAWLHELHRISPSSKKTIIDIGCNKGYTSSKFFGLWAPELGFTPKAIMAKRPDLPARGDPCGACMDCQEEVKSTLTSTQGGLDVYCVEPSQETFAQLVLTRNMFFGAAPANVNWLTINMAMSNVTGNTRFARQCNDELCSLSLDTASNYDIIPSSTIDDFFRDHGLEHVDILKMDTEGYDPSVIEGAMGTLTRNRADVVLFEYNSGGAWETHELRNVVNWLGGVGYTCYFDGKPELTRLTGCWDPSYEFKGWSNVVCVLRSHALYAIMERGSLRHKLFPAAYA